MPLSYKPLLSTPEDIKKLKAPDPYSSPRMSDRLEAIRAFREQVGGEVPIMGWVEGALAEAVDLRGMKSFMMDLIRMPEWVDELLEICAQVSVDFARAQVEAGADIIGLGDAAASLISPTMYQKYALPYEQLVFDEIHADGAIGRLHICGNTNKIVPHMVQSGAEIIDLDWMVDMGKAAEEFGDKVAFCGNFDPVVVLLLGTPKQVYASTIKALEEGGKRSFSAAGCEVPDGTPHENLEAQNRALREFESLVH
jgi:uroporphyrinogen decarboxylase